MSERIVSVNWGDLKYYLEKIEDRRHSVEVILDSYDPIEKTVDVKLDLKYFRQLSIKYYDYKRRWESDSFKVVDSYDPKSKSVDIWIDARDYLFESLDFRNICFEAQDYTENSHIFRLIKMHKISTDSKFAQVLATDLIDNAHYYFNQDELVLRYWNFEKTILKDVSDDLRKLYVNVLN